MSAQNIEDQDVENASNVDDENTYDDSHSYDDDSTDEWSDDTDLDESSSDEEQEAPVAKKKSNTMTIIITLVVAIVGVFGFMIFSGSKNQATQAPVVNNAPINADPDVAQQPNIGDLKVQENQKGESGQDSLVATPSTVTPEENQPPQGLMDNPAALEKSQEKEQALVNVNQAAEAPKNDEIPVDSSNVTPVVDPAKANEVVENIAPDVKPVSDFPTVDSIKKPEGDRVADATLVSDPSAQATSASNIEQDSQNKLKEVQTNLDAAQQKIAQLEKDISDKDVELSAAKQKVLDQVDLIANQDKSRQEVEDLKMKISDLEAKLADKSLEKGGESTPPVKNVDVVKEIDVIADNSNSAKEKISASIKKVPSVSKAQKIIMPVVWTLKSANSTKAVLLDKRTGDLKTVHVGDVVAGLGRILSISDSSSVWVVKGTSGFVTE